LRSQKYAAEVSRYIIAFRDYLIFYHVGDKQRTVYLLGLQHGRRQHGREEDDQ
jgi:hypothetical protein